MMPLSSQNSVGRSSNLSPLAPPFTLEKPYHNQHNSNKPMNFTEPYGPSFDRPRPAWSPTSVNPPYGHNFTKNTTKDDNCSPLDVPKFTVSQSNNTSSSSTRLAPLNSGTSAIGFGRFSYGKYSNPVQTTLTEAKLYYPPYGAADDRELLAHKEPSYDLLSNFGMNQLNGSSQVEDAGTVSGVKYRPQWNGLWNGLNDVEQGSWLDLGGNYSSKDHKHSETSNGQQSMRKDSEAGGDHYNFHVGTRPVGSLGSYVETSIKSANCFEAFGENHIGSASTKDFKSYKEPNRGPTNITCIRLSAPGSSSACNEMTQDPFLQPPLTSYGLYESPVETREKHTNYADSYVFDSTSQVRSSPASTNKMAFGGFRSPQYAVPSAAMDAVRIEAMDVPEKSPDFLPYHPFGLNNFHVSNYTGNTDSLFTGSSSIKLEEKLKNKQANSDSFDLFSETKSMSTVPHLTTTDCNKLKCDAADTFYSMEKFSDGLDIQNTAEDSPCWKGARFSPFEETNTVVPDIVLQMSESCFIQNGEVEQKNNPSRVVNADDTNSTNVLGEANPKVAFSEQDGSCSMMQGLHSSKLFAGEGFHLFEKKLGLDTGIGNDLNYSGIVYSPKEFQPMQIYSEPTQVMPEEKHAPSVADNADNAVELQGKCTDALSSDLLSSSPTSNAGDDVLHSPVKGAATVSGDDGQVSRNDSNSKVDVSMLLNTMRNLSETLVSHCLNSRDPYTEPDHAALNHIISNLNSCLVKKADHATQTEKYQEPEHGTSCLEGALPGQTVSKFTSSDTDQQDLDYFGSWKADINLSDSSSEKDNAESVRDAEIGKDAETVRDAEIGRDAETVQAVKRVLDMTFPSEEMLPETVLYKNLWLEAEAALCTTTVKSRFNRMKIETQKKEVQQKKEEENVPVCNASAVNKAAEPPHEAEMNSSLISRFRTLRSVVEDPQSIKRVACHQNLSLHTEPRESQANNFEASVMARFLTLKTRADNAEDEKPPSKDQSSDHSVEDSYLSAMANHIDDPEPAFMSRFNILKARIEQSESSQPVHPDMASLKGFFSNGNKFLRENGLGGELLEGWYDCSEPGWEHVTKESSPKQKK